MKLLHVVCDYGVGDLAFSEIVSALGRDLPHEVRWHLTSVASFDTISTGFIVAQLSLQASALRPEGTMVFANCAPRRDRTEARVDNDGEGLLFAKLRNGVPLLVVNSGYSLSFVRDQIQDLWSIELPVVSSQFRSRDTFPPVVAKLARGELDFIKDRLDPQQAVPEVPEGVIGYIDSFGNLKTTFREGSESLQRLRSGERVTVTINGIEISATVATGSFNVHEGDIAFAPGSSGHDRRFWEIFQRGGSAWQTFRKPRVGTQIEIKA